MILDDLLAPTCFYGPSAVATPLEIVRSVRKMLETNAAV